MSRSIWLPYDDAAFDLMVLGEVGGLLDSDLCVGGSPRRRPPCASNCSSARYGQHCPGSFSAAWAPRCTGELAKVAWRAEWRLRSLVLHLLQYLKKTPYFLSLACKNTMRSSLCIKYSYLKLYKILRAWSCCSLNPCFLPLLCLPACLPWQSSDHQVCRLGISGSSVMVLLLAADCLCRGGVARRSWVLGLRLPPPRKVGGHSGGPYHRRSRTRRVWKRWQPIRRFHRIEGAWRVVLNLSL